MKDKGHPKYNVFEVTCACGASYEIGTTNDKLHVDICSNCHPLFTGKQKLMDTEGRVEKFKKKYSATPTPKKKTVRVTKKDKAKKK